MDQYPKGERRGGVGRGGRGGVKVFITGIRRIICREARGDLFMMMS